MKKILPLLLLALVAALIVTGCKKRCMSAEGPTDVRILNHTGQSLDDVTVTTTDDVSYDDRVYNYGTVADGAYTDYHRFDIAFPKADITLKIGGVTWSTPSVNFSYLTYIGQDRITYTLTIADQVNHVLGLEVTIEEPIDDL
ncbi:MAG: hypothetical protein R2758_05720 [Bacteroidales bacterium]